jgi:hypothetical protein
VVSKWDEERELWLRKQTTESHLPHPLRPSPLLSPRLPPPLLLSELSPDLPLEVTPTEDEETTPEPPESQGTLVPPAPRAFRKDSSTPLALTASEFVS